MRVVFQQFKKEVFIMITLLTLIAGAELVSSVVNAQTLDTLVNMDIHNFFYKAICLVIIFAFYLLFNGMLFKNNKIYEYTSDLDDLIELTLTQLNIESSEKLSEFKQITLRCLEMSKDILGRGAFRREMKISNPINMNIFETTLYFMSLINGHIIDSEKIANGLMKVITSDEYLGYIGNSRENIRNVSGRFNMMIKLFKEIVYD